VVPAGYPAPPLQNFLASCVGSFQILLIISMFLGEKLMPDYVRENKLACAFGVFMVLNMAAGGLTKTSAFEIYVGDRRVWSTLQHNRMPNMQDLVSGFKKVGISMSK